MTKKSNNIKVTKIAKDIGVDISTGYRELSIE